MAETGKTPVFGAVREAFLLWRAALPRIWTVVVGCGALAAGASFAMVRFAEANVGLYFLAQLLYFSIFAFAYGAQLAACLDIAQTPRRRVMDAARLFGAISIIAFFLFIVFAAAIIPGVIILMTAVPMSPAELEAAQADPAAAMRWAQETVREHSGAMLALGVVYAALWMFLTSRLYLAAPASVADERVRTFETWAWTKGEALRISAARLLLLLPAWAALTLLQAILTTAFGARPLDPASVQALMTDAPLRYLALLAPVQIMSLVVYAGLEAGLSAYLYNGLKAPAAAASG